jgi:hypothetical protein
LPNGLTHAYLARVQVSERTGGGWGGEEYAAWGSPFDGGDGTHRKEGGAVSRITLDKVENLVKIAHSEKGDEV